jgi:hypothetical protein
MTKISIRLLSAAFVLALASAAPPVLAQNTEPSTVEKAESAGGKAWDATKEGGQKAWDATKRGSKKAWNATKKGSKKAWDATKRGANKAAEATRETGEKMGKRVPHTDAYDARQKP